MGLQIVRDALYVHDNLAIQIQRTPDWLSVNPAVGSMAGGVATDVEVRFNSTGLAIGQYAGRLRVASNDPDAGIVDIPVTLQVVAPTGAESALPGVRAVEIVGGNPARGTVRLRLALPKREPVDARVYNVRGVLVRTLARAPVEPGFHVLGWDGRDDHGGRAADGLYFVRVRVGAGFERTLRVALVR